MQRVDKIIYRHHKSHKNVFICEMANNIKNEKKIILGKNKNVVRVRRRCAHMFCVGAFFFHIYINELFVLLMLDLMAQDVYIYEYLVGPKVCERRK